MTIHEFFLFLGGGEGGVVVGRGEMSSPFERRLTRDHYIKWKFLISDTKETQKLIRIVKVPLLIKQQVTAHGKELLFILQELQLSSSTNWNLFTSITINYSSLTESTYNPRHAQTLWSGREKRKGYPTSYCFLI